MRNRKLNKNRKSFFSFLFLFTFFLFLLSFNVSADLTTDLISYYKSDTAGSFPDAEGGNDGTINGASFNSDGLIRGNYDFDGTDDYVTTNNKFPVAKTVSLWVKPDTFTDKFIFDETKRGSGSKGFTIDENSDGTITFFAFTGVNGEFGSVISTTSMSDGNWYHITAKWDGTTNTDAVKLYLNGNLEGTATSPHSISGDSTYNASFGANPDGSSNWNGSIDEVGIWNRSLSEQEIKNLYNRGAGKSYKFFSGVGINKTSLSNQIFSYYKKEETSGGLYDEVSDYTGSIFNGVTRGASGLIKNSYDYDGTDDYVITEYELVGDVTNDGFSISTWVNADNLDSSENEVLISASGSNLPSYGAKLIASTNDKYQYTLGSDSGSTTITSEISYLTNQWNLLTITYNGSFMKFFINGQFQEQKSASFDTSTGVIRNDLSFGSAFAQNHDHAFDGRIDEISVYPRELSEEEIYLLNNDGNGITYPFGAIPPVTDIKTSNINYFNFTVSWEGVTEADNYSIQASKNESFDILEGIDSDSTSQTIETTSTSADVIGLDASTQYYIRIKGNSPDGSSGWNTISEYTMEGIYDYMDFLNLNSERNYVLENNIDIGNNVDLADTPKPNFNGVFDGRGNIIKNLDIEASTRDNVGLFGELGGLEKGQSAKVYDLKINNVNITGDVNIGGLAGYVRSPSLDNPTIIENVAIHGLSSSVGIKSEVGGGIAGRTGKDKVIIKNCYSNVTLDGQSSDASIGGLLGVVDENLILNRSYFAGGMQQTSNAGGLISLGSASFGGIDENYAYWDQDVSGEDDTYSFDGTQYGTAKSTGEMKDINTYSNWDITAVSNNTKDTSYKWNMIDVITYPFLSYEEAKTYTAEKLDYPTNLTETDKTNTSADISWNAVTNAENYDIQMVESGNDFTSGNFVIDASTSNTYYNATGLERGTLYSYRLRATATGYESSDWITTEFQTLIEKLRKPKNLTNSNITYNSFTANWDFSSFLHNGTYIKLSEGSLFEGAIQSTYLNATVKSYTFKNLTEETTYYWRIKRTVDPEREDTENTSESDFAELSVTTPKQGQLAKPQNLDVTYNSDTGNFNVTWGEVTNAEFYNFQISNTSDFSNLISLVDPETNESTDTLQVNDTYVVVGVGSEGSYYIRVNADAENYTISEWANTSYSFDEETTTETDAGFFGEFVDWVLGFFPNSDNLSTAQKLMFVVLTMIIVSGTLVALGWSQTGGVPSAMVYLVSFINTILFLFFLGIGYVPIGFVIILILLIIGIIFLKMKMGGSSE